MSNLPNLSNYEEWLINHLDGLLNDEETSLLLAFLEMHPSIKEEFELLSRQDLAVEPTALSLDFSYLKKPELDTLTPSLENDLIALMEGDLTPLEAENLERQIAIQPKLKQAYALFKKTKISHDGLVFENKEKLKRKKALLIWMFPLRITSIAAAFLLLGYGSWLFLNQSKEINSEQMAVKELPKNSTPSPVKPLSIAKSKPKDGLNIEMAQPVLNPKESKEYLQVLTLPAQPLPPTIIKQGRIEMAAPKPMRVLPFFSTELLAVNEAKFLTPSEWLLQKVKRKIPTQAIAAADSISQGGAGNLALGLLNKTTGISMETYAKENDPRRRVAFVSKYFSYERVSYQKNN